MQYFAKKWQSSKAGTKLNDYLQGMYFEEKQ